MESVTSVEKMNVMIVIAICALLVALKWIIWSAYFLLKVITWKK